MQSHLTTVLQSAGVSDSTSVVRDMSEFLLHSKADGTQTKYFYYFSRWKVFSRVKGFCCLPADSVHVAVYLTHLLKAGSSPNVVSSTVYAIKWAHEVLGYTDPTQNGLVRNLAEAGKRLFSVPVKKKDAIPQEVVVALCEKYCDSLDLCTVRDLCMIVLCFVAFLRYNELSNLKCSDISFHEEYFVIRLSKSKTDQYRSGNEVTIAKGVTSACPFTMLKRYMVLCDCKMGSDDFLFKPLLGSKGVKRKIFKNKCLSYTRARECIVSRLKEIDSTLNIGLHSLRAGGATAAAGCGVNERCLMRHGRWKCVVSKNGYVEDSIDKRLEISRALRL